MKKITTILFSFILLLAVFLAGCVSPQAQNPQTPEDTISPPEQKKLQVFVSFYPYYEIASQIGREHIDIASMIPNGAEPHEYEPSTKQVLALEQSDVFIYNGLGMEEWVEKALPSLPKTVRIIEAGALVPLIKAEEEHHHEEDDHGHSHDNEKEHSHGEYDPHIWLNPANVKIIAEKVKDTFIELDPQNQEIYEANYQSFAKDLHSLDQDYQEALKDVQHKEIVVSHAAFGHLTHRYGLQQHPVAGISPHAEPKPSELVSLQKLMQEENIKYIFMETLAAPKTAEILAKEVGVEVLTLNTLEGLTEEQQQKGETSITLMRKNLENLKKALQ